MKTVTVTLPVCGSCGALLRTVRDGVVIDGALRDPATACASSGGRRVGPAEDPAALCWMCLHHAFDLPDGARVPLLEKQLADQTAEYYRAFAHATEVTGQHLDRADAAEALVAELRATLASNATVIDALHAEVTQDRFALDALREKSEAALQENEMLRGQLDATQDRVRALDAEAEKVHAKFLEMQTQLRAVEQERDALKTALANAQGAIDVRDHDRNPPGQLGPLPPPDLPATQPAKDTQA